MLLASSIALLASLISPAQPILAPNPGPALDLQYVKPIRTVEAVIRGGSADFLGGLIASDSDNLSHALVDLPPLLTNHVIIGVGQAVEGEIHLSVPIQVRLVADLKVFAQAVLLDERGFASSPVESILLPKD